MAAALFLGPSKAGAAELVLSEIMALNVSTLVDEDGDYPDWIEIYNPGDQAVNLADWSLTDDKKHLGRWMFPEVSLAPRKFLMVFASGKNRTNPAGPLHANFRLSETGNYLGLVAPGGVSIVSQFSPQYPPQVEGASFGPAMEIRYQLLLSPGAPARFLVPADDSLKSTWIQKGFDDSGWTSGATGVGFDAKATPTYRDLIATDIQPQMMGINSSVYLRIPFHVDDPSVFSSLVLKMKYEDAFVAWLNGEAVAVARSKNAPASITWNSKATSRRLEKDALVFQEFDLTSRLDLLQPGENLLAIQGLNDIVTGPAFLMLPQLEGVLIDRVQTDSPNYYSQPTPGRPNGAGLPGVAEAPLFSRIGGTFIDNFSLELAVASPNAVIRYTLNLSQPSESSTAYTAPLSITKNTVVKAKTFEPGLVPSPTVTQVFTALDASLKDFSSNLPLLVINTFGIQIPQDPKVPVWFSAFHTYEGRSTLNGSSDLDVQAGIKIRGSSSLSFPKSSFTVETWDGNGRDKQYTMFGLPKESDWVLYAPYTDKTLMRDVLSYEWSNWIGRYAPRTRFVEVFVTFSTAKLRMSDYVGVYVFEERIKEGKDRVDIEHVYRSQNAEPEVSGGYILKKDRLDPGDYGFSTQRGQVLGYVTPKERDLSATKHLEITPQQRTWIKGFLDGFETALYGLSFKDPEIGYAKYIDVDSFIDHHILVELTKNIDGYRLSTFMFKDRKGKLNMGPLWDYNLTLGNANYLSGQVPEGWYYPQLGETDYPWYGRLFQDPAFHPQRYGERWIQFRQDQFALKKLIASIDEKAALLEEAQVRNYVRWPIMGTYVWPNPEPIPKSYAEEISVMEGWLTRRLAWIDTQFLSAPTFSPKAGVVPAGTAVTLSAKAGSIFYDLNYTPVRTDPRLADEGAAPEALEYSAPLTIVTNTRIRARARIGNVWSGLTEATYVVTLPPLVVTEVMYHPPEPPVGTSYTASDLEFVEIENVGDQAFDMAGVQFTDSIRFNFTGKIDSLPPGGHAVVVRKLAAFTDHYDTQGIIVAGEFTGSLSDVRGTIGLRGPLDEQALRFTYDSTWYPETNGGGYSLVVVDPRAPRENWGKKDGWRRSSFPGGSPGVEDPAVVPPGRQVPGDFNQDGKLGLFDAIGILRSVILAASAPLPCEGSLTSAGNKALLDLNGDAAVDISDAVFLLSYLFQRGALPIPGTACAEVEGCPTACAP